jgi:hypothetical protein
MIQRQIQCPHCQQLVFLNRWVGWANWCADCVRSDFGLELGADGKFHLTPEREAQDKAIGQRRMRS